MILGVLFVVNLFFVWGKYCYGKWFDVFVLKYDVKDIMIC